MSKKGELVILALGLVCTVLFAMLPLISPDPETLESLYLKQARIAAGVFYGATATDLGQDIVGMRALWSGEDAYPLLGPAMEELGLHWDLDFHSPHPPPSFLFTAPVAFSPWATASLLWAILMILCWIVSLRLLGLSWNRSVGIGGLLLLWPPAALSLGQLTAPMLLFMMLAYTWRADRPAFAGAAISVAAMAKYSPAIALINFARSPNHWRVLAGFVMAWGIVLGVIFLMSPMAISRYLEINQTNSLGVFLRPDNAAPLAIAWHSFGWFGVTAWLAFVGFVTATNWPSIVENSTRGWIVAFYLSVALLPVVWIYSLLLFLPVAWHLLTTRQKPVSRALLILALLLTVLTPAFGTDASSFVGGATFLFGTALLPQNQ